MGVTDIINDEEWHHVACTYNGQHKMIYVDGFTDKRQYALEEIRDDCGEQVILGARNNGNVPRVMTDVMLDDIAIFGQALTPQQVYALSRGTSPTNLPAKTVELPLIYNFEDGTMQGWRNVLVSRLMCPGNDGIDVDHVQEYTASGRFGYEVGDCKLEMTPYKVSDDYEFKGNSDRRHASLLVRSPQFVLNGSSDLGMWLAGGMGNENEYANESDNIALTHNTFGTMRAYLRRSCDGAYLASLSRTFNNNVEFLSLSAAQLAAYFGETCTVDLINACDGSWGWIGIDEITIPGTLLPEPECGAIQFDMCQQNGTYLGTESPGHTMKKIEDGANWWNGSGIDQNDGQFFQANGAPAPQITIDFGTTVNGAGGVNIDWDNQPIGAFSNSGSGVYNNFLMRDWVCSTNNNDLAVRVKGFTNGLYRVYAMVRDPSAMNATYNVYMGLNLESRADANAVLRGVVGTSATEWKAGENFVYCNLEIESEDDYITVIVDPTADAQGVLQGLQIIDITDIYIGGAILIVR